MPQYSRKLFVNILTSIGVAEGADMDLLAEYIEEAEHQDGYDYWDNFSNPWEAYKDFLLYKENVSEDH